MQTIEQKIGALLLQEGRTISTAESCTGGRLAALLNKWPGSSEWYMGSVVAYSNDVKMRVLGVKETTLKTVGAVSEETVSEMAEGVRSLIRTDYAIATSGIAGPGGGTKEKPVGTVWMAWALPDRTVTRCFHFEGTRDEITALASVTALEELWNILSEK